MQSIKICVGSSCHLKGSYDVIQKFQSIIAKNQLENQVDLRAAFCLGHCTEAVSVMIPTGEIMTVSSETTEAFFETIIKPLL